MTNNELKALRDVAAAQGKMGIVAACQAALMGVGGKRLMKECQAAYNTMVR